MRWKFIPFLFVLAFAVSFGSIASAQNHNCDFAAVITHQDFIIPDITDGLVHPYYPITYDCPEDFFYDYIIQRSGPNPDGYGIIYSADGETTIPPEQIYHSSNVYSVNPNPLDQAHEDIMNPINEAVMVMAHDRTGTGGSGNHPFTLNWEGRTYAFMHNGYIPGSLKQALWWELYYDWPGAPGDWFEQFPSNWVPPGQVHNYNMFIDSEIVFHWIMKNVILNDGSVLAGLYEALTAQINNNVGNFDLYDLLRNHSTSYTLNFVFSDCDALYVFRNRSYNGSSYNISYREYATEGFVGLKTQGTIPDGEVVDQYMLVYIPRGQAPYEIPNFLSSTLPSCFVVDDITSTSIWNGIWCIYDDVNVTNGATLHLYDNTVVEFGGSHVFTIDNGTVILEEGAEIKLGNGSQIRVLGSSSYLRLVNGSAISGFSVDDRITTDEYGLFSTEQWMDAIGRTRLYSRSSTRWGGVTIKNPRPYLFPVSMYTFWDCDISECERFSVTDNATGLDMARIDFRRTGFTDSKQILIEDKHLLHFENSLYSLNSHPLTIDMKARLNMYNSTVEKGGWEGVKIGYTGGPINITDSIFYANGHSGVRSSSNINTFIKNKVIGNCCSPMPVGTPAGLKLEKGSKVTAVNGFRENHFKGNGRAEYEAGYYAFNWPNQNNTFSNNYMYVLMCLDYDQYPSPTPRPVYGNAFYFNTENQFYPNIEAFDFEEDSTSKKK